MMVRSLFFLFLTVSNCPSAIADTSSDEFSGSSDKMIRPPDVSPLSASQQNAAVQAAIKSLVRKGDDRTVKRMRLVLSHAPFRMQSNTDALGSISTLETNSTRLEEVAEYSYTHKPLGPFHFHQSLAVDTTKCTLTKTLENVGTAEQLNQYGLAHKDFITTSLPGISKMNKMYLARPVTSKTLFPHYWPININNTGLTYKNSDNNATGGVNEVLTIIAPSEFRAHEIITLVRSIAKQCQ